MRRRTSRPLVGAAGLALLALGVLLPDPSAAAEAAGTVPDETARWVPAVGAALGIAGHYADASAQSGALTGSSPTGPVRPPAVGNEVLIGPVAAASFELMTPRLADGFGRPRLFGRLDLGAELGFSNDVAKEGVPGPLVIPSTPFQEVAVPGQGSLSEVEPQPLAVTAGVGTAFTFERSGRRFRLKPSFEYLWRRVQLTGVVTRAVGLNPNPSDMRSTDFRLIRIAGQRTKSYHAIGPGLELELDAARLSPFTMTVFLAGQIHALLGDRDLRVDGRFSDAMGSESASWHYRPNSFVYRGFVGVRLRWLPDDGS